MSIATSTIPGGLVRRYGNRSSRWFCFSCFLNSGWNVGWRANGFELDDDGHAQFESNAGGERRGGTRLHFSGALTGWLAGLIGLGAAGLAAWIYRDDLRGRTTGLGVARVARVHFDAGGDDVVRAGDSNRTSVGTTARVLLYVDAGRYEGHRRADGNPAQPDSAPAGLARRRRR